jgi:uncharacterized repeat protein (TIGR02543 family)
MTRLGYRFDGWTAGSTGGILYAAGATYPVAANITFYAKWTAQVTVTYNGNGTTTNVPASQTAYVGDSVTLREPGSMALTGYNFAGWTAGGTSGIFYGAGASYPVSGAITFWAKWAEKVNAVAPNIGTISNSVVGINEPVTTSASVSAADGATITYQWYSHTSNLNSGGSILTGETGASLSGLATATTGTKYFYVVVTNTIADNGDGGIKSASSTSNAATIVVKTLKERIADANGKTVTITLYADEDFATIGGLVVTGNIDGSATHITLASSGAHTVQLTGSDTIGYMFLITHGASLTMETGVTLKGPSSDNYNPLVGVTGSFTMNGGVIRDNNNIANGSGGVMVLETGSFIMTDGTITGNYGSQGGGVQTNGNGSSFDMSGGSIDGNSCRFNGGGVYVLPYSTFTMSGGTIRNNIVPLSSIPNVGYGGGVYVSTNATFSKTGPSVIYGSNGGGYANTAGNGLGHAVYWQTGNDTYKKRDTTLAGGVNLSTSSTTNWD